MRSIRALGKEAVHARVEVTHMPGTGKAPGLLSQRASATLGAPVGGSLSSPYGSRGMSPFRAQRYRTLDNHDGSYLILLDPAQQQVPDAARQGSGSAR